MFKILEKAEIFPVSLEETKAHLRIEHKEEDAYLEHLIETATEHVQDYLNRSLLQQKIFYKAYGKFREDGLLEVRLPRPNITSIESVIGIRGGIGRYSVKRFHLLHENVSPRLVAYTTDPVLEVTYYSGYGLYPKHIPAPVKHGVLQFIAELYEKRVVSVAEAAYFYSDLLKAYKVIRG
jgi:uncharacterized phiE125 gp8 family phage protein